MLMRIKFKATLQAVVPLNVDDAAQTPDSVKAEVDFFGAHLHSWAELQQSNDSQGTQLPSHFSQFIIYRCKMLQLIYYL